MHFFKHSAYFCTQRPDPYSLAYSSPYIYPHQRTDSLPHLPWSLQTPDVSRYSLEPPSRHPSVSQKPGSHDIQPSLPLSALGYALCHALSAHRGNIRSLARSTFSPGNLPVTSPFSSSTDLIAHNLLMRHVTLFTQCFIVAYFPGSVLFPTAYSVVISGNPHHMVRAYHLQ